MNINEERILMKLWKKEELEADDKKVVDTIRKEIQNPDQTILNRLKENLPKLVDVLTIEFYSK